MARFAAIGLDHRHIYDLTQDLIDAGAECVGYNPDTTDQRVLAGFRKRFPLVSAAETTRLLDDPSIDFVVIAARPCDRAELAIAAMRRGKDVMVDKPGITTLEQLAAVERAVAETGRLAAARALVPALDQTRNVGLVVLPGAYVGLLLGGASPAEAGRVQFLVLLGLLVAETVAALVVTRLLGDPLGRLRPMSAAAANRAE